jgi:DNA-binding CsgD family transcriptional regulator
MGGFMSLSLELERNICQAWQRVRNEILADPAELHRRLGRWGSRTLARPPRAWCIAIRASDRRIGPGHWLITPEHAMDLDHPEHPYEPIEHEVTIQSHGIRRCCHPIRIGKPAEEVDEVARRLGVRPQMLRRARLAGIYRENFKKGLGGKRGYPVPIIYREELHDPGSASFFRPPHAIWGAAWEFLAGELFPDNFEQTVRRKPVVGTWGCEAVKLRAQADQMYKDEMKFLGWRWLCPGCGKAVRTIYYPIPVLTLFDRWVSDPVMEKKLAESDCGEGPAPTFACHRCHRVKFFSSVDRSTWNQVIGYLTAGMLYGCEVERPAGFVGERRRTRVRQLHREAPMRRKVLSRLSNGWSNMRIARDLGISQNAVNLQVGAICREEEVADRHALAKKLNFAVSPPPNQIERAMTRRFAVREMLVKNCSLAEMCGKLSASLSVITADIWKIYKLYGIKGRGLEQRRALAAKLGVSFMSKGDQMRERIAELCARGMTYKQVGEVVGISVWSIWSHMAKVKKRKVAEKAGVALACP